MAWLTLLLVVAFGESSQCPDPAVLERTLKDPAVQNCLGIQHVDISELDAKSFYSMALHGQEPLIIEGDDQLATLQALWTDNFLSDKVGDQDGVVAVARADESGVPVTVFPDPRDENIQDTMKLRHFLESYRTEVHAPNSGSRLYLQNSVFHGLSSFLSRYAF